MLFAVDPHAVFASPGRQAQMQGQLLSFLQPKADLHLALPGQLRADTQMHLVRRLKADLTANVLMQPDFPLTKGCDVLAQISIGSGKVRRAARNGIPGLAPNAAAAQGGVVVKICIPLPAHANCGSVIKLPLKKIGVFLLPGHQEHLPVPKQAGQRRTGFVVGCLRV
ncbi:hypothetical protein SDC9_107282 [bioreactor metagenome]|uniref:Uncharacterized protein n=1 Tax=bioreactor metagenome TaxID=1076179 RepID=A0A645B745_9ZZZZ